MDRLLSEQAVIDYLIANVPHDDYGDELDADELREMWTERINSIPSAELHLVNGSQGLVKELVNKDDALRSIEQYVDKFDCIDVNFLDGLKTAMQLIRELPFAEPQERTGNWQITDAYPHNVYCSECHKRFAQTHWTVWEDGSLPRKFCPNCGRKMEVDT